MAQYCTFYLDGYFFGLDVTSVQEVIRFQEMTAIPLADRMVRGLINLRGQIVTAIDLRCCLDMPERDADAAPPMNVVVRTPEGAVSCLVDKIGDVLEVDEDLFEAPPETIEGVARELIQGCYKLEGALLMILDVEKAIGVSTAV